MKHTPAHHTAWWLSYTEDRGHGPGNGWKDASVVVNWKVGPLLDKRQNLCLPFEVPNDRRDRVKIEVE